MLGQPFFHPGQFDLAGRVVKGVVVPRAPFEERPDGNQAHMLRAERHRLPGLFVAVVVKPTLVAFQNGLGHFGGLHHAALAAPLDEVAQVNFPVAHGALAVIFHPHPVQERGHQHGEAARVGRIADNAPGVTMAFSGHGGCSVFRALLRHRRGRLFNTRVRAVFGADHPRHPADHGPTRPRPVSVLPPPGRHRSRVSPGQAGP